MSTQTTENGDLTQNSGLKSSANEGAKPNRRTYVPPHMRNSRKQSAPKQSSNPVDNWPSPGEASDAGKWGDIVENNNAVSQSRSRSRSPTSNGNRGGSWQPRSKQGGYQDKGRPTGGGGGGGQKYQQDEFGEYPDYPGRDKEHNSRKGWKRDERSPFEGLNVEKSTAGINFDAYDIPVETSPDDDTVPAKINRFDEINFGETLSDNIAQARYANPTPVQRYGLPIAHAGRDLMACAQTGSGKTATFLFPIIAFLIRRPPVKVDSGSYRRKAYPQSLIIAPTRELATQIYEEARKFSWRTGLHAVVVYGGANIGQQLHELERGPCDILVATPGRLTDIIERGRISLSKISFLVLDEADRMLDMGFEPQIRRIVEGEDMPATGTRHTLMFSATFPKQIQMLASCFLHDYVFLRVGRVGSTTELVTQKFLKVNEDEKRDVLCDLLQGCQDGLTLIFVETRRAADSLEYFLTENSFPAISIHGDRSQSEREHALRSFKKGITPFLIATNVASRGLDIRDINCVINFDMPNDIDEYVHRIGRTGRAGKAGVATSFISPQNKGIVRDLLELLHESGQDVPGWLESMKSFGGSSGGRGGPRRRGGGNNYEGRFGGRDFRQNGGKSGGAGNTGGGSRGGNNNSNSHNNRGGGGGDSSWGNNSGGSWGGGGGFSAGGGGGGFYGGGGGGSYGGSYVSGGGGW